MIRIKFDYFVAGLTLYCLVARVVYEDMYDFVIKEFLVVPVDPFVLLVENAINACSYEHFPVEDWEDGTYHVSVFQQIGASPDPTSDDKVGAGNIYVRNGIQTDAVEIL